MITLPTNFVSELTGSLSAQLTDAGTLAVVIFVAAIPLAFFVIHKLIDLFKKPTEEDSERWDEENTAREKKEETGPARESVETRRLHALAKDPFYPTSKIK